MLGICFSGTWSWVIYDLLLKDNQSLDRQTARQLTKSVIRVMFVLCLLLRQSNGQYQDAAEARWHFLMGMVFIEKRKGRESNFLTTVVFKPRKCFCFYTCHTPFFLSQQNHVAKWQHVRQTAFSKREARGGDNRRSGEREKQMSCNANSKESPVFTTVLQHILGRASAAACRQTFPARCSLCSSLLSSQQQLF